ncbi:hypothetical protein I2703_000344 [Vibrio alginolyticus]|nr:hypothetical protein [Vibrio alginolyticus]
MTKNIEQRTLAATNTLESSAKTVDYLAHTDDDVETPVGKRKSFPRLSREFEEGFINSQSIRDEQFQKRFTVAGQVLPWSPQILISNPLQRYSTGSLEVGDYREFLPNPDKVPFTTSASFNDDLILLRWQENSVASKKYADEKVKAFFNIAEMQAHDHFYAGLTLRTENRLAQGDRGGATYVVSDSLVADGYLNIDLGNGFTAVFQGDYVLTSQLGITDTTENASSILTSTQELIDRICINTSFEMEDRWLLKSNKEYYQVPGTLLKKSPNFSPSRSMILCDDYVDNVLFLYPKMDGNRDLIPNTSEHGHLFDIRGAKNITVQQGLGSNGTGDAFYVGGGVVNRYAENIHLNDCEGRNNRRQALSITSVIGFRAPNFKGGYTNGIAPESGIDIEPNDNNAELKDIVLDNPITTENSGFGIVIAINRLVGPNSKEVSITIKNHKDFGSSNAFCCEKLDTTGHAEINGTIEVLHPTSFDSKLSPIVQRNYDSKGPEVLVYKPKIINPNRSGNTSPKYGSSIVSYREELDSGAMTVGCLRVVNPSFDYRQSSPVSDFHFYDETGIDMVGIKVINPEQKKGSAQILGFRAPGYGHITDVENVLGEEFSVSFTVNKSTYLPCYLNDPYTSINIQCASGLNHGYPSSKFIKQGSKLNAPWFRVSPPDGGEIIDSSGGVVNGQFEATIEGSELELKPIGNNQFIVVSISGDWKRR